METVSRITPFVTFYSFKGGVGRSMALINTAGMLARRGFSVLVIDLDLEAPGLSYLPTSPASSPPIPTAGAREQHLGFVDLLSNAKEFGEDADLFKLSINELAAKYTRNYVLPSEASKFPEGSLHIMPAGKFDGSYAKRFDDLDLHGLYQDGVGEPLIRVFKNKIAESGLYNYVLVDSRTGFSDEAGICTRDLADYLIILSGLNGQNVEGTCEFLRALRKATDGKKSFRVILSPVPNGEDHLVDNREKVAKASFEAAWGDQVDLSLQIPYHPQLALTEEPHIFRRRRGYLFEAYRHLESNLLKSLGHTAGKLQEEVVDLIQDRRYPEAYKLMQDMVRLEDGDRSLIFVTFALVNPDRRKAEGIERDAERSKPVKPKPTLAGVFSDPTGKNIIEFIVRHIKIDDATNLVLRYLLPQLTRISINLAEELHRRAIDESPTARNIREYARFFANEAKDYNKAAEFLGRAIEANPLDPHYLGDYGQILVAIGRLEDGRRALEKSWNALPAEERGNRAEVCFALWLTLKLLKNDEAALWESQFKRFIQRGFERHDWSFEPMLLKAAQLLRPSEMTYAKALAAAFLDPSAARKLVKNRRWNKLAAVDSDPISNPPPSPKGRDANLS